MRNHRNEPAALTHTQSLPAPAGENLQRPGKSCRALTSAVITALLLSACASQPMERPVVQLTRAEAAIQDAIQAGARQTAPVELQTAQEHLSQAQSASAREQYQQAFRLAEKAEVDAQLAESKARTAETYNALAELKEGIRVLEQELQRGTERPAQ